MESAPAAAASLEGEMLGSTSTSVQGPAFGSDFLRDSFPFSFLHLQFAVKMAHSHEESNATRSTKSLNATAVGHAFEHSFLRVQFGALFTKSLANKDHPETDPPLLKVTANMVQYDPLPDGAGYVDEDEHVVEIQATLENAPTYVLRPIFDVLMTSFSKNGNAALENYDLDITNAYFYAIIIHSIFSVDNK